MAYIRTHHFARTFMAFLLGLPFVLGVFSNTRPDVPDLYQNYSSEPSAAEQQRPKQSELFGHLKLNYKIDA